MQLRSRLNRLSVKGMSKKVEENFVLTEEVEVERVVELIKSDNFSLVVIDSIQSMTYINSKGYPGSISQVRVSGSVLTRISKVTGVPMFIVGQINKGGDIAGPKVCLLYTSRCV